MLLSRDRQGELFIFFEALLWGLFPVIIILSYNNHISPLLALAGSTFFAALFFGGVVWVRGKFHEIKNKSALVDILWMTFYIAILFYVFFFFGLKYTSAGNASIIALTETLFSYLLFNIWHEEYISRKHIAGAILLLVGAVVVLSPNFTKFQSGDILVLLAAFFGPFGNFYQRRARQKVSSEVIMFVRSVVATPILFLLAYIFGEQIIANQISGSIGFLVINGVMLLGVSKILWIEGIHRISVTKANALGVISSLFTLVFAWFFLGQWPTVWQLVAILPIFFGVILLGINKEPKSYELNQV